MKHFFALVLCICATFYMFVYNDYMHEKSFRAEVVSKDMSQGLKGKTNITITYKREDGHIFTLSADANEWQSAVSGQKRWVSASQNQVEPSGIDSLLYTVFPIVLGMFTTLYLIFFLFFVSLTPNTQETKFVPPSTKGPFEK
ncbi:hypothetical protein D3C73_946610 [compost metagenome]